MLRPATHAGSWYSKSPEKLAKEVSDWLGASKDSIELSRFAIGPHAGYRFCGPVLGFTYSSLPPDITKIVIMGPSHFKYFKGLRTTHFSSFETPLGAVDIDVDVVDELLENESKTATIQLLDEGSDLKEHSWEMHLPFIKAVAPNAKLVPLLFGAGSRDLDQLSSASVTLLKKLFSDPTCAFVVSSDFCHWGDGFDYTPFADRAPLIYKFIQKLDEQALDVLASGSSKNWAEYIKKTKNTICGEKPIGFLLKLGEESGTPLKFKSLNYRQSSKVREAYDMSVSYASAIAPSI